MLPSCALMGERPKQIEIVTKIIPVLIAPVIPTDPVAPDLAELLPTSITVTAEESAYYSEVCEEYESGEYNDVDLQSKYLMSRSAACDWAVEGFTVQGMLTLRDIFTFQSNYAESARIQMKFLREMITAMYEASTRKVQQEKAGE
jgi:hypothetical protein